MKIAVCDDDNQITRFVESEIMSTNNNYSCDVYTDGGKLIHYLESSDERYNIYFLDIEMPLLNGIDTAIQIRKKDKYALIVFVTDYKDYVFEIFEVLPFRFLQKPLDRNQFHKVLNDAVSHITATNQIFFYQISHEQRQLLYKEIIYFEGAGRKVRIHSAGEPVEFYERISRIAEIADKYLFTQIHASYIVNMEFIRIIRADEVALSEGITLPVSRKYHSLLKQNHMHFLKRRGGVL